MEAVLLHLSDKVLDDDPNVCGQAVRANASVVRNSTLDKALDESSANVRAHGVDGTEGVAEPQEDVIDAVAATGGKALRLAAFSPKDAQYLAVLRRGETGAP